MKVAFFGTPIFSAEILSYLVDQGLNIVAVVTQPDKVQGRHLKLQESAVKKVAKRMLPHVPIYQPEKIRTEEFYQTIQKHNADVFIVVAFGQIFPTNLLELPRLGCINIHTSLLPKYRGAAPIQRCLMAGEMETGVSIMYMVKELDAGDVLATKKVPITPQMNAATLTIALCQEAKKLLLNTLSELESGKIKAIPQDHTRTTYAPKVTQEDAKINWDSSSITIYNQFRGVSPKPGAWCIITIRDKNYRLKVLSLSLGVMNSSEPGSILAYQADGIVVGCKEGSIKITELQLEGKNAITSAEFIKGYSLDEVSFKPGAVSQDK